MTHAPLPSEQPLSRFYSEMADWWPLLSAPDDYAEEAAFYLNRLFSFHANTPRTLLELGSGGGNNASHMKHSLQLTLVEPSAGMLDVSRALNPECEHIQGDMRTVRLGRQFDCVFIHDAICYMITEDDLRRAVETAFVHLKPGGVALFAPDYTRENFRESTDHGGHDGPDRALRFLEWTWDPDPSDSTYIADYAFMLRERDGSVRVEYDRHREGLFARADWVRILEDVGFESTMVPFTHSEISDLDLEVFVGRRPHPLTPSTAQRERGDEPV